MKIKFNLEERQVLMGLLLETRRGVINRLTEIDYLRSIDELDQSEYEAKFEDVKRIKDRATRLVEKFNGKANFTKIKAIDLKEVYKIVEYAVSNIHDKDGRPSLTEDTKLICENAIIKMEEKLVWT